MGITTTLRSIAITLGDSTCRTIYKFRRKKIVSQYLKDAQIKKLQIGGAGNILTGWLNTDLSPCPGVMFLDASKRFPFDDCTFDYVFSEHFIEHVDYLTGIQVLHESFRVLKPGGRIRIATPDLKFLVDLYREDKTELQKKYVKWAMDKFIHYPASEENNEAFIVNNFFRSWGHKFIYDYKTLKASLEKCGFVEVKGCAIGESYDPSLRGLESHSRIIGADFNRLESMVLEGLKPNSS